MRKTKTEKDNAASVAEQRLADAGHACTWQPANTRMTDAEHRIAYSRMSVLYGKGIKPAVEYLQDERMAATTKAEVEAASRQRPAQATLPLPPQDLPMLRFVSSSPVSHAERQALAAVGMIVEIADEHEG